MSHVQPPIRVVVADDHARVRRHVVEALTRGGCEVVAEVATSHDAVDAVLSHAPDLVLLDVHMPGNGIAAAEQIARSASSVAVVMLSQSAEDDDVLDAVRAGAAGYLLKDEDLEGLASALRVVVDGGSALSSVLVTRLLEEFRAPSRGGAHRHGAAVARLTTREWDVMHLLVQGYTTQQVAARLFLSTTTVRVHVSSVVRKLRVADREAALAVLRTTR